MIASGVLTPVSGSKVCDKADKMDVEGFAKEQQVLLLLLRVECLMVGWSQVTALLKQQAADLTTFVATTVNEAIEDKATIQDCAQLQKRIEEVTGEVSWHSTVALSLGTDPSPFHHYKGDSLYRKPCSGQLLEHSQSTNPALELSQRPT